MPHAAVVVLEIVDEHRIPQIAQLEIPHEVGIDHGELPGQVRLHIQVLVGRLDGLGDAGDVGDGRGRRDGHHIGVAHALRLHRRAQPVPIQRLAEIHLDVLRAADVDHALEGIDGQDAAAPQGALVGRVAAALRRERAGGLDGEIAHGLHGAVGEGHGLLRAVGDVLLVQGILKAHQAEAHRAVPQVGFPRLLRRVVVDVDDIVQHAHGGAHGLFQFAQVEAVLADMLREIDRAEVAHRDLLAAGVQRDLGAQVGGMHHPGMLLRGAQVARIFEGDPRMAGLEQHAQHLAPQGLGGDGLVQLELAPGRHRLVLLIALVEGAPVQVVQIGHIVRGEQGPIPAAQHPLHEQIRHPVGGVHVVGAAAVVAGVLAQLQELLDVEVPSFEIGAHGALALAALIHGDSGVVDHLEEGHDALGFAVGALDVRAEGPHRSPIVAEPAGELGQHGVVADGIVDAAEVVGHRGQVAGG